MDIAALKQQARALEQEGRTDEALAVYRQILAELEAIGGIRQELPVLIKIGDLEFKAGNPDGAVDMYERAADEYAAQGAAQPVMSLCIKIVRADPQAVGAYLRLARHLLDGGFTEGARDILMDYAKRAKLDKTRDGLERLASRPEDEVKRVLAKAIDVAAERAPKRKRPSKPTAPPPEVAPPPAPPPAAEPPKRLTVPVGAIDAEPEPSLLEQRPPEPRPAAKPETVIPRPEDLQAPILPEVPTPPRPAPRPAEKPAAPPRPPEPPEPPKKRITGPVGAIDADLEPNLLQQRPPEQRPEVLPESLFPKPEDLQAPVLPPKKPAPTRPAPRVGPPPPEAVAPPPLPPLPQGPPPPIPPLPPPAPPAAPPPRASTELLIEPSFAPPPPTPPPGEPRRDQVLIGGPLVSRPQPRPSRVSMAATRPQRPRRLWPIVGVVVLVGGVGAALWFRVIPLERLRGVLPQQQPQPAQARPELGPPPEPTVDTLMARDTAVAAPIGSAEPAPEVEPAAPPLIPPALPPGLVLSRPVYLVSGLAVESVEEISPDNRPGYRIAQVTRSGERIILEQFPAAPSVPEGEIGVTGLPGDTVVGHVVIGGLDVTLKGVISEISAVELLQRLVQVRP